MSDGRRRTARTARARTARARPSRRVIDDVGAVAAGRKVAAADRTHCCRVLVVSSDARNGESLLCERRCGVRPPPFIAAQKRAHRGAPRAREAAVWSPPTSSELTPPQRGAFRSFRDPTPTVMSTTLRASPPPAAPPSFTLHRALHDGRPGSWC